MPDGYRALLDINVILDVLQRRQPFYDDSAPVLAAAETGRLVGLVAAHSVTTLFYLLAKLGSPGVPMASSRCSGTTQPISPSGVCLFNTT